MKSTFRFSRDDTLTSAISPEEPKPEEKKLSSQSSQNSDTTPMQSPLVISTCDDTLNTSQGETSSTPITKDIFDYSTTIDKKFIESESGNDEAASPQISPSTSDDKGHMSDTVDSGYEGRKSTTEINEAECQLAPQFLQQLPENMHIIEGDCARLDVKLESGENVEVNWFKDSQPIAVTDRIEFESEDKKYSMIIRDVELSDDAEYECRAINELGTMSTFVELYVVQNT